VRAVSEAGFGRLSIITNTLWAVDPLARLIGGFRRLHPGVQVTVADPVHRGDVLDAVRLGGAELGLLDGTPPGEVLAGCWVADHEFVAMLPPGPEPAKPGVSIGDLVSLGLVSTPEGTALRAVVDDLLEAAGRPTDVAVETAHVASVVPLVLAGAGATVLPRGMAADAAATGVRVLPLEPPARCSVHLIWRAGRLSPLAQHFVDYCADATLPRQGIDGGSPAHTRSV
jgi:DNA-binding transcriptional LysR family regulator